MIIDIRVMTLTSFLYLVSQIPSLIEIKSDLRKPNQEAAHIQRSIEQMKNDLFYVTMHAQSPNQERIVSELEGILGKKNPFVSHQETYRGDADMEFKIYSK